MNLKLKDLGFTSLINKLGDNYSIHSVKREVLDSIYFISSEMMISTLSISIIFDLMIKIQSRTFQSCLMGLLTVAQ